MKNVVYFLGAGFSVPAGLPVISNFLFKAKDQFYSSAAASTTYSHFQKSFDYIDRLSKLKNYVNTYIFNIEEVFSIADTHKLMGKRARSDLEH